MIDLSWFDNKVILITWWHSDRGVNKNGYQNKVLNIDKR